jgi:hypothetical protein
LLDFAFLIDLTAKLNYLDFELQGDNKTTIKMMGTIDSTFNEFVYLLCTDKLLKGFKRIFKDFERMKFNLSFITNPFQERDISESAELISPVFKENVSELELEIINLQTDLLKTRLNDTNFWNLVPSEQCPFLKRVSLKVNASFGFTYLNESGFPTMKILKSKYRSSLTDKHLNDCMRVALTKYTPNYNKLAEEMQ